MRMLPPESLLTWTTAWAGRSLESIAPWCRWLAVRALADPPRPADCRGGRLLAPPGVVLREILPAHARHADCYTSAAAEGAESARHGGRAPRFGRRLRVSAVKRR
jgi:hypothetical protein